METRIALFQKKEIRKTLHQNEWWVVLTDVVAVLTDSANSSGYLKDVRKRDASLADAFKGGANCPPLRWNFQLLAAHRSSNAGTPRVFSA